MLRLIFFVIVMLGGTASAVYSRFGGLLFYLWFAMFRPQEWVWIDITPFRLSLVVGLLFVVPSLLSGVLPNLTHPLSIACLGFLASALVAQMGAVNQAVGWFWMDHLVRQILISLMLITLVNTRQRLLAIFGVISIPMLFHAFRFGVNFILFGGARFDLGTGGSWGSNNEFALAVARVIFLFVAFAQLVPSRITRIGMFGVLPFLVLAVVSTYSRGGFLALACGGFAYLLLQRKKFIAVAALGLMVIPMVRMLPEAYFSRIDTINSYEEVQDDSALARLHVWSVAMRMVPENPFGVGLRNFEHNYDRYDDSGGRYSTGRSVHNSHLQALAETGYLGFAFYLFLTLGSFWMLLRTRRRALKSTLSADDSHFYVTAANALIASHLTFMVGGTFAAEALNELNWFTFGMVAALDRVCRADCATSDRSVKVPEPMAASLPRFGEGRPVSVPMRSMPNSTGGLG